LLDALDRVGVLECSRFKQPIRRIAWSLAVQVLVGFVPDTHCQHQHIMKRDSLFPPIGQTHRQYASGLATGCGAAVSLPVRFWRAQPIVQRIAPAPRRWKTVAVSRQSVKISTELGKAPARDGSYSSAFTARFSTSAGSRAAETRLPSPNDPERGLRLCR
jgi:hypothetical protein